MSELFQVELSRYFTLYPGDLVFTGTPACVGRLLTTITLREEASQCC